MYFVKYINSKQSI